MDLISHIAYFAILLFCYFIVLCVLPSENILLLINLMKVLNKFFKNGTGNYVEGVVNGRTGSGPVRSTSCETPHNTFKIASWNIGTMRGRSSEIVETITRRTLTFAACKRSGGKVLRQDT